MLIILSLTLKMTQVCIVAKVTSDYWLMAMKVMVAGEDNQPYSAAQFHGSVSNCGLHYAWICFVYTCNCMCVCVVHSLVVLQVPLWWSVC